MPPRPITLTIVAFWLAAMSWLFSQEIWPALRPGERSPFTIDLSREAQGVKAATRWTLYRNQVRIGYALTATTYRPNEQLYDLTTRIHLEKEQENEGQRLKYAFLGMEIEVDKMASMYRVTQEGELRSFDGRISLSLRSKTLAPEQVEIQIHGDVADRTFSPRWKVHSTLLGTHDFNADPVEIHSHDSMLNPMQPWNRLRNVQKRQQWRMVLFDPLADSLGSMVPGRKPAVRYLEAGVLETTDELAWDDNNVTCLVIEYRGENLTARTWVRESDGLVLRQEAIRNDGGREDQLALVREPR
jgi:hypothetical protein